MDTFDERQNLLIVRHFSRKFFFTLTSLLVCLYSRTVLFSFFLENICGRKNKHNSLLISWYGRWLIIISIAFPASSMSSHDLLITKSTLFEDTLTSVNLVPRVVILTLVPIALRWPTIGRTHFSYYEPRRGWKSEKTTKYNVSERLMRVKLNKLSHWTK